MSKPRIFDPQTPPKNAAPALMRAAIANTQAHCGNCTHLTDRAREPFCKHFYEDPMPHTRRLDHMCCTAWTSNT